MDKRILAAAVRFIAPSALAVGALLAATPAYAGATEAMMEKAPHPTAASARLLATAQNLGSSRGRPAHASQASHSSDSHAITAPSYMRWRASK